MKIVYQTGQVTGIELYKFLKKCNNQFTPPLSSKVNLKCYSDKLLKDSTLICLKQDDMILGIVAFYANEISLGYAFISLICVQEGFENKYLGSRLMKECLIQIKRKGFKSVKLEVDNENHKGNYFYTKFGFTALKQDPQSTLMEKQLK